MGELGGLVIDYFMMLEMLVLGADIADASWHREAT